MTRIEAVRAGARFRITASGHAAGDPAACSGVSALLGALACWLRNAPAGVTVHSATLAPGAAALEFSGGTAAQAAAELCVLGLLEIALAAPAAVAVTLREAEEAAPDAPTFDSCHSEALNGPWESVPLRAEIPDCHVGGVAAASQ